MLHVPCTHGGGGGGVGILYKPSLNNVWMHHHFLKLNINKTDVMEISLYPSLMPKVFTHCSLFLDDNNHLNFDMVKQVKTLGFIFHDTLCLEPQINQVIKTCYYRLHNLYKIGNMLNKDRKLQLVTSYIFSCLDSCNILYYGLSKKLLTRLQVLLNDRVHFVYAKYRFCWREGVSVNKLVMELHIYLFVFVFYIKFH